MYVAAASGGLWKSENQGMTFTPLFQQNGAMSLGSVACAPDDPNIVYLGTGEASSRNSAGWGDGLYKSEDGGKNWKKLGLDKSLQIGRIAVNPKNHNLVFVAATGNLWGAGGDRGLYRSEDGGKTLVPVIKGDDNTGAIDVIINPNKPNEMLAAMWQRRRWAYNFNSGGPGSALYRSTDSGKTWKKVAKGLPPGPLGRIGLTWSVSKPNVVMATVERPPNGDLAQVNPDGSEVSGGLFRSEDGGESFKRVNLYNPRPFYFSIPRIDPSNDQIVYVPGVDLSRSLDGGKTVRAFSSRPHSDYHAYWIDPKDGAHMFAGTDGGLYETRDNGETWMLHDSLPIGQFYAATFDMRKPYWVYGGLQDNNSWGGPTQSVRGGIGAWEWRAVNGGDGFHFQVDWEDNTTYYTESQGGAVTRGDFVSGIGGGGARPPGEARRFNWSTPIVLSPHSPKILYVANNQLWRSVTGGRNWTAMSPDLTTNNPAKMRIGEGSVTPESTSAEHHCTIITVGESAVKQGTIWTGSDDGQVQVTADDGKTWTNVTKNIPGVPEGTWVSRVTPSNFDANRCYVTLDGHRNGDFKPYVFVTEDLGKTWKSISNNLPGDRSVYVITEGLKNESFLMVGTEMGLFMSVDGGDSWKQYLGGTFPNVRVDDIKIHTRELDAVVATHGRAIWVINVSAMEQLNTSRPVSLFKPQNVLFLGRRTGGGDEVTHFRLPNPQFAGEVYFFCKKKPIQKPRLILKEMTGQVLRNVEVDAVAGLNKVSMNVVPAKGDKTYIVELLVDGIPYQTGLTVEDVSAKLAE